MKVKTGIGQDSHAFDRDDRKKVLVLGGVEISGGTPLKGNSDADVILHALTNAISGITGRNILGAVADDMCLKQGITDSRRFVKEAMKHLGRYRITHVSIAVECREPKLALWNDAIRRSVARLVGVAKEDVGLTATTGEELTDFGRGKGIQAFCAVTAVAG